MILLPVRLHSAFPEDAAELFAVIFLPDIGEQSSQRQRRPVGNHILGMIRYDHIPVGKAQPFPEDADKDRIKGKGAALEGHGLSDLQTLGQTSDGLLGDGVEGGQRQVLPGNSLVQEGLNIRLGEHAASSGDIIDRLALLRSPVEILYRNPQNLCHLIDESARSSGTAAVHAHVIHLQAPACGILPEEDDLCILTAQLDGRSHIAVTGTKRQRVGDDFLDKGNARPVRDDLRAGPCHDDTKRTACAGFCKPFYSVNHTLQLFRMMSAVVRVNDFPRVGIRGRHLGCGGPHINSYQIILRMLLSLHVFHFASKPLN